MRSCSRSAAGVCATVRLGFAGLAIGEAVWNRPISPQAASAKTAHSRTGAAQSRRLVQISRRPANPATAATRILSDELIPTQQLNLPHPEHVDSRPTTRLDPATDTNPSVLKGLKDNSGSLDSWNHAP